MLQYIYLSIFVISLLCTKMVGVETMYVIQLSFYCLLPVGAYSSAYLFGLTGMKYVSGYNLFFQYLPQTEISNHYSALGVQSNFLSNVNLMMTPLAVCLFLALILHVVGTKSRHYKTKPRLLRYCRAFLLEFPLTILLFNSFNIYISLIVDFEYLKTQSIPALLVSLIVALLLPLAITLLLIYQ